MASLQIEDLYKQEGGLYLPRAVHSRALRAREVLGNTSGEGVSIAPKEHKQEGECSYKQEGECNQIFDLYGT